MKKEIKTAAKRTWWYRAYAWLSQIFTPPYTWQDLKRDIDKENGVQKNERE